VLFINAIKLYIKTFDNITFLKTNKNLHGFLYILKLMLLHKKMLKISIKLLGILNLVDLVNIIF